MALSSLTWFVKAESEAGLLLTSLDSGSAVRSLAGEEEEEEEEQEDL